MIRLEDIHKSYAGISVLKGVSLNLNKGDFVTLIGKIGSGKSTLINIISGLVKPDKGRIFYKDEEVNYMNRSYIRDFGVLLSGDYLFEDFSAIHYWSSLCKILNISYVDSKSKISQLIELLGIKEPTKPIGKLSSGNRMLVKIGTMLLNNPKVLIIDEPFVHLDILEIKTIEDVLLRFHSDGNTILLSTHYPEPIYNIGTKLVVLKDGAIKMKFSTSDYPDYLSFKTGLAEYFSITNTLGT